ncbi:MAG: hypothetical protein HY231_14260 [Acidobacteria bacterium]|nr:hypothetical protein [Acidobacteriota bacterium]
MNETFDDITIIGKPDPEKVKVGSKAYTRIFAFSLSAVPPERWNELLIQEWNYRIMQTPRQLWVKDSALVLDCRSDELAAIVERVGVDMQIVNRKYRKEMENTLARTHQETAQAVEEKRVDDASVKKIIEALLLPVR